MATQIWKDSSVFEQLQGEWSELARKNATPGLFLTPQFAKVWWEVFGKKEGNALTVVTATDAVGELKALFSLFTNVSTRSGEFIGDHDLSDYLDVLTKGIISQSELNELLHSLDWQQLQFVSVSESSLLRKYLPELAKEQGFTYSEVSQDICPVITLPSTWEEYLAQIGKKQRHEIRRKWQKLDQEVKLSFRHVASEENLSIQVKDFIRLHQLSGQDKAAFWTPDREKYFYSLTQVAAQHGWLQLIFADIDQVPAAAMLCFDFEGRRYLYNSGLDVAQFSKFGVGHVLTAYTIKDAIEKKLQFYDFLRGSEEYKQRYKPTNTTVFDLKITKN